MSKTNLLILLLLPILIASAILQQKTLRELAKEQKGLSTDYASAVKFLDRTHPELETYLVVDITKEVDRGDQVNAKNLVDFHFTLEGSGRRVLAIVTVSGTDGKEFVSISPFVMKLPNLEKEGSVGEYWLSEKVPDGTGNNIIIQSITSTQEKITYDGKGSLGGFQAYEDFSDPLVGYSRDFLAGAHPNMVNYRLESAEYQLVAGVNVKLNYVGLDKFTTLTVILGFNLKNEAKLLHMEADCMEKTDVCSRARAWEYFNAMEAMLISHPELMKYRIKSVSVEDQEKFKVMVTLDSEVQKLRSLVEMLIEGNKFTVQSFFTYSLN